MCLHWLSLTVTSEGAVGPQPLEWMNGLSWQTRDDDHDDDDLTHGGKMSSENLTGAKFDDPQCRWFPVCGSLMCYTSLGWRLFSDKAMKRSRHQISRIFIFSLSWFFPLTNKCFLMHRHVLCIFSGTITDIQTHLRSLKTACSSDKYWTPPALSVTDRS